MTEELRLQIGQRLAVGFEGVQAPPELVELIKKYKVGNIIYFRRNVESFDQLRALCAQLRALILEETGIEPYLMIDEECGSVSRLAHVAAQTPSAMAIGATGDVENAYRIGRLIGQELRAVGVNFNLAPVLDCITNPAAGHGNRCFSSIPQEVAAYGNAYVRGVQEMGVLACGKHFPGHGDTETDSHLALPIVNKTEDEVRRAELVSFKAAIAAGIQGIMTAHVVFPALEPERVPATVSRRLLTGLLREEMGFRGILLSDSMEMNAVKDLYGVEGGTLRALAAGVDIALICHSVETAGRACELLYEAAADGRLPMDEIAAKFEHIVACKKTLLPPEGGVELFGGPEQQALARQIMAASVRVLHAPEGKPLPRLNENTLFLGLPARAPSPASDEVPLNAPSCLAAELGGRYIAPDQPLPEADTAVVILTKHPDLEKAVAAANALAARGTRVIAVTMNVPLCLRGLTPDIWQAAAWQYDPLALEAVAKFLK